MSQSLAAGVEGLRARGVITDPQAAFLGRVARGELVSIRGELQVALWLGVSLITAGAGLLVKENLGRLGPATIAVGLGLASALCLLRVARTSAPFSWGRVAAPSLGFDYLLLLGVLLLGSDLAYVETRFRVLGAQWPWHLLLLSAIQLAFAFRYDSRAVLSLALASFAAWRGVALSFPAGALVGHHEQAIRANAVVVGALFLGAGALLARRGRKAHFEPTFGNLGLMLVLGAAVAGMFTEPGPGGLWPAALAAAAAATILLAFRARRSDYFAQGVVAAYIGALRLAAELHAGTPILYLVSAGSFGVLALIVWAHRRFREDG